MARREQLLIKEGKTRKEFSMQHRLRISTVLAVLALFGLTSQVRAGTELQASVVDPLGSEDNLIAEQLTTTPTTPIARASNPRYFLYGGQTVALVGLSGETVPHIGSNMIHFYEWCHYEYFFDGSQRKYQHCIDQLQQAGLNTIRLWVAFNFLQDPYDHAQPFLPDACGMGKWDLNTRDPEYFRRIQEVVQYAQDRGIIVEVTIFVPPTGGADPSMGPWANGKNCQNLYFRTPGTATENAGYFYQADNSAADPFNAATVIDTDSNNKALRQTQVKVVQWLVDALASYNNVYYELANEPDLAGLSSGFTTFDNLRVWHHYMARKLWEYEDLHYPTRHHLIAANLSVRSVVNSVAAETRSKIDIISSHYVKAVNAKPGVAEVDRLAGIKLLHTLNTYTGAVPDATNRKIWGMNETHITGITGNLSATAISARDEAWHLMMNGGGLYDHYSYNWGNQNAVDNNAQSEAARAQLGYLARFVNTLPLASMRRSMPVASTLWVSMPVGAYPAGSDLVGCDGTGYCWSAMEEPGTKVLYIHHSGLSASGGFRRYEPQSRSCSASCLTSCSSTCQSSCYFESGLTLSLKNLGTCAGTYVGEWYTPDGTYKDAAGNLTPIPGKSFTVNWSPSQVYQLQTPQCYGHDIVLKVRRTSPPC